MSAEIVSWPCHSVRCVYARDLGLRNFEARNTDEASEGIDKGLRTLLQIIENCGQHLLSSQRILPGLQMGRILAGFKQLRIFDECLLERPGNKSVRTLKAIQR